MLTARDADTTVASAALEKLCLIYWRPLYTFIRREGYREADAQDLTQAFFAHLLAKEFLTRLPDQRARFRSFLLTFLKHFLADERDRAGALKRCGDKVFVPLDDFMEQDGHGPAAPTTLAPDQAYERRWAETDITPFEGPDGKLLAEPAKTIEQLNAAGLAALGITTISKTLVLNSLIAIDPALDKCEGVCLVGNTIVLTHDNDFNLGDPGATTTPNPLPGGPPFQVILQTPVNQPKIYTVPLP